MIRVLFIHQNLPGYERVAIGAAAAARRGQPVARVPVDSQQGGCDPACLQAMPSLPAPALEDTV